MLKHLFNTDVSLCDDKKMIMGTHHLVPFQEGAALINMNVLMKKCTEKKNI